jgi:serine/threonine protein kinase
VSAHGSARRLVQAMSFQPSEPSRERLDPRIGGRIGGYLIVSVLGSGGYGKVYLATAPDGTQVALKLVRKQSVQDETFRLRFIREAEIASTVVNDHLVPVLGMGEHDGLPYMAQKFIDGGSLEQMLERYGRLDVPWTVHVCEQAARGLDALAAAGVFHRDVKPGNIMLDTEGKVYVTDFGLAKDTGAVGLTQPGQTVGSMDYMAPEQIRGQALSAAIDVYALGCVMYECMSGHPPFSDRKGMDILWAHLRDEPADPCAGREDVPREFVTELLRALAKDPADRPASAGEYARSLRVSSGL